MGREGGLDNPGHGHGHDFMNGELGLGEDLGGRVAVVSVARRSHHS